MTGWIGRLGVVAGIVAIVTACGVAPGPTPPGPTDVASADAGLATAGPSGQDDAAIAYAISQRRQFGLRSDEAWVRRVAADPRARIQVLDFLMLPEEEAEFQARQASFDELTAAVNAYAEAHPEDFGGVWIDQAQRTVVTAWTTTPPVHRLAILASIRKPGPLEARLVRYPEKRLRALQDRIGGDWAWMRDIPAAPESVGVDIKANTTEVGISSANPQAAALILAHYGVPLDMLRVTSDGTGILLKKRGTVHVTVLTSAGKAPGPNGLWPLWTPDRRNGGAGDCGSGAGMGVAADGTFDLPCAPGGWTIEIRPSGGLEQPVVGRGHVVVPEGRDVDLRITLDPGANLRP